MRRPRVLVSGHVTRIRMFGNENAVVGKKLFLYSSIVYNYADYFKSAFNNKRAIYVATSVNIFTKNLTMVTHSESTSCFYFRVLFLIHKDKNLIKNIILNTTSHGTNKKID